MPVGNHQKPQQCRGVQSSKRLLGTNLILKEMITETVVTVDYLMETL
jgi:hypothetical protein